jgi:protein tyrosine phosphatase (PTP) superfamily phosphohydrolase (DUF442 family)
VKTSSNWRRALRASLALILLLALPLGAAITWRRASGNLGTVRPHRVYRSAQLDGPGFARLIREKGIRTILNLRGPNPDQPWYRAELAASKAANVTHIDLPMASDQWLSHEQAESLLSVLDTCDFPLLIHCEFGAERTGLVSAVVELLDPASSLDDAEGQFTLRHLFLPIKDGRVMLGHLRQYEAWLAARGEPHSPDRFRRWLARDYRPGSPSREYWPCNPYPRLVVTSSAEQTVETSANACPKSVAVRPSQAGSRSE